MKEQNREGRFDKWFCAYIVTIGLIMLAGLIWVPVPKENQSIANTALGFITATIIAVPLAYIFGGNPIATKRPGEAGTTTASIRATIHSEPNEPKPEEEHG